MGLPKAPSGPKIPEPQKIEEVEKIEESEGEVKRKQRKSIADTGRQTNILAGIQNALKKRLGE